MANSNLPNFEMRKENIWSNRTWNWKIDLGILSLLKQLVLENTWDGINDAVQLLRDVFSEKMEKIVMTKTDFLE